MSIIIDMLKDLDQRKTNTRDLPDISLINREHRQRFINYSLVRNIVVVSGVIILSIAIIYSFTLLFHPKKKSSQLIFQAVETQTKTAAENPADMAWLKPVQINGVTLQIKDNITEITFLLSHAALYRIISDNMQNQIGLIFDNAQLQSELPPIDHLNTAIQKFSVANNNKEARFNLTLAAGAVIKYINLTEVTNGAELSVAIETPLTDKSNSAVVSSIKSPALQTLLNQQYQTAVLSAKNGNFPVAIERLSDLLKASPTFSDARTSLAALLIDQGHSSQAEKIVEDGLILNPDDIRLIELKSRVLVLSGKIHQALALLQSVSPPIDDNTDYYANIAALHARLNQDEFAMRIYRQLLNINPENSRWWFGLALSFDKQGKQSLAMEAYNKALTTGNLTAESITYSQNRIQLLQGDTNETS